MWTSSYSTSGTSRHSAYGRRVDRSLRPLLVAPPNPLSVKRSRRQKMKRVTLLCGLLLAMSASVAAASGVGLRWQACLGDAGAINRNFACNTNAGTNNILVGTFELGAAGLANVSGNEVVIDLGAAGATLPA